MINPQSCFKGFKLTKKRTIEMIPSADFIIFSLSSSMLTAIIFKKKVMCIQSNMMGDYLINISNKYINSLKLLKINIDNNVKINKKFFNERMSSSINNYDKFIKNKLKVDNNIRSSTKIIDTVKKDFNF